MSEQPPQDPGAGWTPPGAVPVPPPVPTPPAAAGPQPGYAYPPPPPGYYPIPPQETPQPSNTLAVIALICAVLPCGVTWIAAIVLAIIVLVRAKKGTVRGRGMAIAALLISVVWLIAAAIGTVLLFNEVTKYDAARDANEGTISTDMIRSGDCFSELPEGEEISTVEIIPCAKEHHGEVFAVFSISPEEGASQDDIYDLAQEGCASRFEDFVGTSIRETELEYSLIAPDKDAVDFDDDVSCYLYQPGKVSTGSLEGSQR